MLASTVKKGVYVLLPASSECAPLLSARAVTWACLMTVDSPMASPPSLRKPWVWHGALAMQVPEVLQGSVFLCWQCAEGLPLQRHASLLNYQRSPHTQAQCCV
jgi:hypothetical protein